MEITGDSLSDIFQNIQNYVLDLESKTTKLEEENTNLKNDLNKLRNEVQEANDKLSKLEKERNELMSKIDELQREAEEKEAQFSKKIEELSSKDEKLAQVLKEKEELEQELNDIRVQLDKISSLYKELSAEKNDEDKIELSELLSIYVVLLENVFAGKPHARILYTLQTSSQTIDRRALTNAIGIQPAVVLHAIHDLVNAGLVSYNEETQEITLLKKIF